MSKRASTAPGDRPPVNFSSSLTISSKAVLTGTHSITLQSESVVHPGARLESSVGGVFVGRRCVVYEKAHLGAPPLPRGRDGEHAPPGGVSIGDYVIVEAGAAVEAGNTQVGDYSVVGIGARIGAGATVGKNCTLGPKSVVQPREVVPDNTVIYASGTRRVDKRDMADLRKAGLLKQIGVLRHMVASAPEKFQA